MAFQVSAGINISEIDLTTAIPSISTTIGAIGGVFNWGPIDKFVLVDSENTLVSSYGRPDNNTFETFFTAANFLAYGNQLYVSRAAVTTGSSNSQIVTLNSNTTISANGTSIGATVGSAVFGAGIPGGAFVTATTDSAITINLSATTSSAQTVNFYSNTMSFNAVSNSAPVALAGFIVKNRDHYDTLSFGSGVEYAARYPGDRGNSLKVSVCSTKAQYSSVINPYSVSGYSNSTVIPSVGGITLAVNSTTANVFIANSATLSFASTYLAATAMRDSITIGDFFEIGNSSIGTQYLKVKSVGQLANTGGLSPTGPVFFNVTFEDPFKLSTAYSSNAVTRNWEYFNNVSVDPGTSPTLIDNGNGSVVDQVSVVVVDQNGNFTGTPGTILEIYQNVSRATDAKNAEGTTNYYKTVINDNSRYIWFVNDRSGASSNTAALVTGAAALVPYTVSFVGGRDGLNETNITNAALATAYDLFKDPTGVDVALVMAGKATSNQLPNYLIDNIAENRKDCIVFISPTRANVVNNVGSEATDTVAFRKSLRNTSYAFIDSGYKYQYDKYNDIYRYVPLNGDIAGLTARSDDLADPWFSPAGFNRGQIKNLVKLAYSPSKADRDLLYKNDINPVVTFPGQGTVLYGDKTALGKSSAFDRINVRRLFIVLEKTVANASNQTMFEFNDEFTRSQFRNLVEPFLRDIKGRRGIFDFRVVCDETNNTAEIVDSNRFVGDIYVKPARAINFIQLNFVAVRTGVEFNEIVGKF